MTNDQLKQLQEYAAALLSPDEIAILLNLPLDERKSFTVRCRSQQGSVEYEAFHRGRLQTKLELRQNIIKLAKAGSPAAEPLVLRFLKEQNID
ncbi:MAG: hypothetical protein PHG06_22460 [Parabacteroides sp.]|nr:hypothetical protein [Parabacteroides sp.]